MAKSMYVYMPDGSQVPRCMSNHPENAWLQCQKKAEHNRTETPVAHLNGQVAWLGKHPPVAAFPGYPPGSSIPVDPEYPPTPLSDFKERFLAATGRPAMFAAAAEWKPTAEDQLTEWWYKTAADEIGATVAKAIEYGSTDLIDIGLMLARTMKRTIDEQEAAELGVFFYLIGKIARWQSAIERGDRPSDDTLTDIGVYVRMAQRIRHAGGWPGVDQPLANSTSMASLNADNPAHARFCDGTCQRHPAANCPAQPLNHTDSDRWTGGDKKDEK